jgi:hypothetical protein
MAYFNLRIGPGSILTIIIVVVFVAVYIFQGAPGVPRIKETPAPGKILDEQTKKQILESLSPPPGAAVHTDEEKRQILDALQAPEGPTLTDEEKKAILESLSAPTE